jgi:CheY-like chemotaxis protein/HPt (histidine-containing phosphotransfer) domain-containing protein
VTLPVLAAQEPPTPSLWQDLAPSAQGARVLVAEDNTTNQVVAFGMLRKLGYEDVVIANDGKEALDLVLDGHFDLVLMDCQMPELDGYRATAAIRESKAGRDAHLTVVAMTAHALKGDRERCLAAGMDDYLSKPLRPNDLDAVLERWLRAAPAGAAAPAPAAAEPDDALVDEERMRVFREDYPEIVEQLVDLFVDSTPPLLTDLRSAVQDGDAEAVRRTAHKLKGSCQNIGAARLAALAAAIEKGESAPPDVDGLEQVFDATCDALRAALVPAGR